MSLEGSRNSKSLINIFRCLATQAQAKTQDTNNKAPNAKEQQKENQSFVHNLFRGEVQHAQLFPFPMALDTEQIEYIGAFVDPVSKFFTEVNDPVRNDENAKIDDATLEAMWELGAFGLMVPVEYEGLGLNNTQYGRLCEIIGGHDLGVGICAGAHQSIGYKVKKILLDCFPHC